MTDTGQVAFVTDYVYAI